MVKDDDTVGKPDADEAGLPYVQRVRDHTRQYVHGLLAERESLRGLVTALEENNRALEMQVQALRMELEHYHNARVRMEEQLKQSEQHNQRFSDEFLQIEQQNNNLANLYVASFRLHGTVDKKELLLAIQEIVANLIGSEELGVYEMVAGGRTLTLVHSFGINADRLQRVTVGAGKIGAAVAQGKVYVREGPAGAGEEPDDSLTACIPLKLDDEVVGAIAIFRLLQQKASLEAVDLELFDLLATHAATALYAANLKLRLEGEREGR